MVWFGGASRKALAYSSERHLGLVQAYADRRRVKDQDNTDQNKKQGRARNLLPLDIHAAVAGPACPDDSGFSTYAVPLSLTVMPRYYSSSLSFGILDTRHGTLHLSLSLFAAYRARAVVAVLQRNLDGYSSTIDSFLTPGERTWPGMQRPAAAWQKRDALDGSCWQARGNAARSPTAVTGRGPCRDQV